MTIVASMWRQVRYNHSPATPTGLSPANGTTIATGPTLSATHSDLDDLAPTDFEDRKARALVLDGHDTFLSASG